ncbi:MAG TPA: phage tail protein [Allocoleopsis sp.]
MPIDRRPGQASSLLEYLPIIFQEGSQPAQSNFLGRFLLAFERILLGLGEVSAEAPQPGLEEILGGGAIADPDRILEQSSGEKKVLAGIQRYFEPGVRLQNDQFQLLTPLESTPSEFLPWLASWVAFTLRQDWNDLEKRQFISQIVPLYRQRGTKNGLENLLRAYTGLPGRNVEILEFTQPMQVGNTFVGIDTVVGGGSPHYFLVKMSLPAPDPAARLRKEQIARAIIDQEKPAHTYYDLRTEVPTMQIGVRSTIGVDTLLGKPSD